MSLHNSSFSQVLPSDKSGATFLRMSIVLDESDCDDDVDDDIDDGNGDGVLAEIGEDDSDDEINEDSDENQKEEE